MTIATKQQYNELSQAGMCGNFLRIFKEALDVSFADGWITIRSAYKADDKFIASITVENALLALNSQQNLPDGWPSSYYFQQIPPPTTGRNFNLEIGEISNAPFFGAPALYLESSTLEPVRGIRERVKPILGRPSVNAALSLLRDDSRFELEALMELYSGHIIEATEFSEPCGWFNKHLVIWEVRAY